jgi:broad specificity phosphatase PhoE
MSKQNSSSDKPRPRPHAERGAADRVSIYVVRHANAVARGAWPGSDVLRPLNDRGHRQARALVDHFDTGPGDRGPHTRASCVLPKPTLLMSSRAERCLATLQPLAHACGLPIIAAEFLSEGSAADSFLVQVKELAATAGVPVLCTHGDVIWSLVDVLSAAGTRFASPVDVKKGSILILETESGSVESARYIPPDKV